ncbi:hypothetical protein Tco_0232117 [Tanacetum coccineum]
MSMTIQSVVKDKILATSSETPKVENAPAEMLRDMDQQMERGHMMVSTLWIKLFMEVKKERVNLRVRALAIDHSVLSKRKILAAQVRRSSKRNVIRRRTTWFRSTDGKERRREFVLYGSNLDNSKEWNSSDDQLRLRWMIYLVVLADAAGSVRDAIRFEYNLASLRGWTKSPFLWAEIGESSLTGLELVLEMADKVVLIKEKLKAVRDHQKSYVDYRRKPLEFEVGDRVLLRVMPWKDVVHFGKKG